MATRPAQFQDSYLGMYGKTTRSVTFVVTDDCNLRCSYCYQGNKQKQSMTREIAAQAVEMLFAQDMAHSRYINPDIADGLILEFIGGEPMLEMELIDFIVGRFLDRAIALGHRWATRYMLSMSSNGTRYRQPEVQQFLHRYKGRVSLGITVDGNQALHDACRVFPDGSGSYALAADAFQDVIRRHGQTGTKLTIAPANLPYLYQAVRDMVDGFDLRDLHANCVFEEGWTLEHARMLYEQLKQIADWLLDSGRYQTTTFSMFEPAHGRPMSSEQNDNWCGGTGKMLAIGTDGMLYPCLRYVPSSLPPGIEPMVIGDVWRGIEADAEQRQCVDCLKAITRRSQSTDECFDCPVASGCAWCSAYNYQCFGTPNKRATYICWMHRARSLATAYYQNRVCALEGAKEPYPVHLPRTLAEQIVDREEYDRLVSMAISTHMPA